MTHRDRAWLDVDGDALRHNFSALRQRARVPLLPMVKADSYGIGAVAVTRALGVPFRGPHETPRAESPAPPSDAPWGVGIASLDEAEALREAGCAGRILCATPLLAHELPRALALDVRPALHRPDDIAQWWTLGQGRTPRHAPWHLSIDTGMARAGIRWDAVASLREAVAKAPPEGVFTHFHSADESLPSRDEQDARFEQALGVLHDVLPPGVLLHRDNSGGIVSRTGGSPGHLARPGIALYAGMFTAELGLRQVAHLRARVVDVRDVLPGESVSYGATWTAPGAHRIATLSAGYADGYRRHLSNVGEVLIGGTRCPVVGRVTMDMTMVDVSGVSCVPGDVATLLGTDGGSTLTAEAVGARAGVSPYELLVGLRLRVPPIYHSILPSTSSSGSSES
ncbi:alanine racemase [Gemmatimonas aurantiaca]|uniref:alanine racemase n=1 Tax=Gemmatimonas aurantiaca TaxID=173480 RepID=UPI00301C2DB8